MSCWVNVLKVRWRGSVILNDFTVFYAFSICMTNIKICYFQWCVFNKDLYMIWRLNKTKKWWFFFSIVFYYYSLSFLYTPLLLISVHTFFFSTAATSIIITPNIWRMEVKLYILNFCLIISNIFFLIFVYGIMQYKNVWKLCMMRNVTNVRYEFLVVRMNEKMGNWKCIV